jgi:hypothetical protein
MKKAALRRPLLFTTMPGRRYRRTDLGFTRYRHQKAKAGQARLSPAIPFIAFRQVTSFSGGRKNKMKGPLSDVHGLALSATRPNTLCYCAL